MLITCPVEKLAFRIAESHINYHKGGLVSACRKLSQMILTEADVDMAALLLKSKEWVSLTRDIDCLYKEVYNGDVSDYEVIFLMKKRRRRLVYELKAKYGLTDCRLFIW